MKTILKLTAKHFKATESYYKEVEKAKKLLENRGYKVERGEE